MVVTQRIINLFTIYSRTLCIGSNILCEFITDINGTFLDKNLKLLIWPHTIQNGKVKSSIYKRVQAFAANYIIVRLKFESSNVEMTVLDSRSTFSDKIAKLGGTFGIWVQLTGCTLLVLINVFVVLFKLGFKICK